MKLRISSLGPVALLASSMMLAFGAQAASADQGIVIYNAQHENLVKSWVDGFTKDTGIKVTLRNGGDSELGNQLVQEGSASPADVFLTENSRRWCWWITPSCSPRWTPRRWPRWNRSIAQATAAGSASPPALPCSSTTRPS